MKKKFFASLILFLPLLSACEKQLDEEKSTETMQMVMPTNGKSVHPTKGMETWFAYGAMTGKKETPANGVAQGYLFEKGGYALTAQVNVLPAPEGSFYEGWLRNAAGDTVSAGHLVNQFGDARHFIRFESDTDYSDHLTVLVTLEKDDGNSAMGDIVAEALLKVTER